MKIASTLDGVSDCGVNVCGHKGLKMRVFGSSLL